MCLMSFTKFWFQHDEELSFEDALEQLKVGFNDYIGNKVLSKVDLGDMGTLVIELELDLEPFNRNFLHWTATEKVSRFRTAVPVHTERGAAGDDWGK